LVYYKDADRTLEKINQYTLELPSGHVQRS